MTHGTSSSSAFNTLVLFIAGCLLLACVQVQAAYVGFVSGDSFSNDPYDWPPKSKIATIHSTAIAGQRLIQMELTFAGQLAQQIEDHDIDFAVIQGGINDVRLSSETLQMMQTATENMASLAIANGVPLLIINIAPWNGISTDAQRAKLYGYNDWLESRFSGVAGVRVIDIFAILGDPADANRLNPAFDLGDGLHPNKAGYQAIADAIDLNIEPVIADLAMIKPVPIAPSLLLLSSALVALGLRAGSVRIARSAERDLRFRA